MTVTAVAFFGFLLLAFPMYMVILGATAVGIVLTTTNPVILIQQIYNGLDSFILLAVPFFIMSGAVASQGDIAKRIVNVTNLLVGRMSGGLGMATVIACAFFGAITGSSMATVVAIGALMIPSLIKAGYSKETAIGINTSAGSLGVMIPPSIPMVLLCVALGTSVGKQFLAGFLPGILMALAWCAYIWLRAGRNPNIVRPEKLTLKQAAKVVKDSALALLFPVIILGGIYGGITTPTEASAVALIYVLLVELFVYKKIKWSEITKILAKAAAESGALSLIIGVAQVLTWFMTTEQLPAMMSEFMARTISSPIVLLLVLDVLLLIVGCFMNVTSMVIVLGPMLVPTLEYFKIDLIHFGIIAVVMSQIGFVTPPFGLNLFVATGVAKEPIDVVVKATMPYLLILIGVAFILTFVPQISTWLPSVLMK